MIAALLLMVLHPAQRSGKNQGWIAYALAATVLPTSAAVFSAVLLRDVMLKKLLRRVIGTRGVCRTCG